MRPTFMGFEIAKRAAMISQKGLDITGHNLSNMTTAGYSRQRVDVYAVAPPTYSKRFGTNRTYLSGQGSDAAGISQVRDKFLDKRFRDEYGDVGYYDKTTDILSDIEGVLNEFGINPEDSKAQSAMEAALNKITSTLQSMTNKQADSTTYATILFTAFKDMAQLLNQFDTKLNDVATHAYNDLEASVGSINTMLQRISELNENIATDMLITKASNGQYYGPNELMDERNLLLDELSSFGDTLITYNPDGTVDVDMNGHRVVNAQTRKYDQFQVRRDQNGTASLTWQSSGKEVSLTKGALKGSVDMINGRGANAHLTNERSGIKGVRYYKDKINALADRLAKVANNSIPQYLTVDGTPGGNPVLDADGNYMFATLTKDTTYDAGTKVPAGATFPGVTYLNGNSTTTGPATLPAGTVLSTSVTAADGSTLPAGVPLPADAQVLAGTTLPANTTFPAGVKVPVEAELQTSVVVSEGTANPMWNTGFYPKMQSEYRPLLETIDGGLSITAANIAVSSEWADDHSFAIYMKDNTTSAPLAKMLQSLTTDTFKFKGDGEISDGLFEGTFGGFIKGYVTELGTDITFHTSRLSATTEITTDLVNRRDEVSGVSQDECTVDMMTYGRSFQAAGRLMTALDEALDVIINKMGLVGR